MVRLIFIHWIICLFILYIYELIFFFLFFYYYFWLLVFYKMRDDTRVIYRAPKLTKNRLGIIRKNSFSERRCRLSKYNKYIKEKKEEKKMYNEKFYDFILI